MPVKVKRKSTKSMLRHLERTRVQLEQQLLESQMDALNFVDPRDAYRDEFGEEWDYVGGWGDPDENVEPFRNENELGMIRRRARRTVQRNPYAENFLINLTSFVVGKGHMYKVTPKTKKETPKEDLIQSLQEFIDELLKLNKWKKRQKEVYRRMHRDGEAIIRIFPQEDGMSHFRFVEPYELATPSRYSAIENYTFGIRTDEEDVETVEAYYINDEEVPYYEVQHRKLNVDMNVKRGLSTVWCILANLDRAQNLLRNMSTVVSIQAAIAMIRKHDTSATAVRSFAQNSASETWTSSTGEERRAKRFRPGTIIDSKKGTEYEFPSIGLDPSAPVEVLGAELRAIASCKSMPEYMVGSDSSNSNYSNTMVAESPAVRFFEGEQEDLIEADLDLIQTAIDHAIDRGRLSPEVKKLKIVVTAPKLVTRDPESVAKCDSIYMTARVKSPQTVQGELGLDSDEEFENWQKFQDQMVDDPMINPNAGMEEDNQDDASKSKPGTKSSKTKSSGRSSTKKTKSVKKAA